MKDRLLFLKEFTKELIINSKIPGEETEKKEIVAPLKPIEEKPFFPIMPHKTTPLPQKIQIARTYAKPLIFKPSIMPLKPKPFLLPQPSQQPSKLEELNLGKISYLIKDPRTNMIECPGPDKLVVVKSFGKINVTNLSLSREEISSIIETFSKEAKIPVISGLFKAVVGNLIITAVVSELVGSRFIITKMMQPSQVRQFGRNY